MDNEFIVVIYLSVFEEHTILFSKNSTRHDKKAL